MIYDLYGGLPGMMYISRDFEVSWEYHRVYIYMTDLILIVQFFPLGTNWIEYGHPGVDRILLTCLYSILSISGLLYIIYTYIFVHTDHVDSLNFWRVSRIGHVLELPLLSSQHLYDKFAFSDLPQVPKYTEYISILYTIHPAQFSGHLNDESE